MAKNPRKKANKQQPEKVRLLLLHEEKTSKKTPVKVSKKSESKSKTVKKGSTKKSSVKKTAKQASKTKAAAKVAAKKTVIKKSKAKTATQKKQPQKKKLPKKPAKSTLAKAPTKPKKRSHSKNRQISLPLGRHTKLTISLDRSKSTAKKRKNRAKSKSKKAPKYFGKALSRRQQTALSLAIMVAGILGTIYFGLQAVVAPVPATPSAPVNQQKPVAEPVQPVVKSLPPAEPTRLRIPAVQIDTELTTVGLKEDGSIEVPKRYQIAGRYNGSPTPGEIGPSIIVGHLDNIHGLAVFFRLRELSPGQVIEVSRNDGTVAVFKVDAIKEYPQKEFPAQEVYGNINYSGLRLITCSGKFNRVTQKYSHNTVVFASLVT